jgi:hypothetical protein
MLLLPAAMAEEPPPVPPLQVPAAARSCGCGCGCGCAACLYQCSCCACVAYSCPCCGCDLAGGHASGSADGGRETCFCCCGVACRLDPCCDPCFCCAPFRGPRRFQVPMAAIKRQWEAEGAQTNL